MYKLGKNNRKWFIFSLCNFFVVSCYAIEQNNTFDATTIPFEELLQTDYIPASKIAEQISSASSAVSVVTSREIKLFGYKTLADVLNSMRGLHTFQDYEYTFLGGRGYGEPGDYTGRIVLLIDGYLANDSFYGQAFFENDGLLDVSLIERVEYIPGGSSAGYTSNALLGVINIITKKGSDINGTNIAYGYGSHNTKTRRVTFGHVLDNGADVLFSLSDLNTAGRDFTYGSGGQKVSNTNNDAKNYRMFLKTSYKNLSLEGALVSHTKQKPAYPSMNVDTNLPLKHQDRNSFVRLKYDADISKNTKFSTSVWYGQYFYDFKDFTNSFEPFGVKAKWYGYDFKLIGTWFDKHTLSIGSDYRHDYRFNDYIIYDDGIDNYTYTPKKTYSTYIYDDYAMLDNLNLNYGIRYEKVNTNTQKLISPQISLIWQVQNNTSLKLSTSKTSRQPTVYEYVENKTEKAKKTEFVIEHTIDDTRLLASLYRYSIYDRLFWYDVSDIDAKGFETEINKYFDNDVYLKASYTYQKAYEVEDKKSLINVPTHMAKLHLSRPLLGKKLQSGLEVLYLGSRLDSEYDKVKSHMVVNLNLLSQDWIQNINLSFKINNLFDKKYKDIMYTNSSGEKYYPQDGRTFYLEMEYRF
ncbi:MAG: TonB-dependent receptor [Arcobacteraceae bacterium]|nr:TonB-dependent receptor [Arcobacteraceae bacterium]